MITPLHFSLGNRVRPHCKINKIKEANILDVHGNYYLDETEKKMETKDIHHVSIDTYLNLCLLCYILLFLIIGSKVKA